jgi:glycosyltransferase involved in cell wall biosynthesis
VHTHGYRSDVIAGLAARRGGIPTVTTLHGFTRHGVKNRVFEWLQLRAAAASDAAIAVSEPLLAELERRGVPRERIALIPNRLGPSTAPYLTRDAARARLGLAPDGRVVGWMGRLSIEKDPASFVRAFAAMRRDDERACIVGDGPERAVAAATAASLGVADVVHFAGALPDAGKLLAAFDLLVLSSRTEGTPMVVLEAAQAGTPVVSTPVGGVPALLSDDGGWLAESTDAAALAAAIRSALGDRDAAMRRAAALRARLGQAETTEWLARHRALYAGLRAKH